MAVSKDRFTQRRDQLAERRRRRLRRVRRLLLEMMNDLPAEIAATRKTPSYQVHSNIGIVQNLLEIFRPIDFLN
jgi:hypothetical protein